MGDFFDVVKGSLELSATLLEGMEHIQAQFDAGHYEAVLPLFQDAVQAFIAIQEAIQPVLIQLPAHRLESLAELIRGSLEQTVLAYEQNNWWAASELMQNQLLPGFLSWKGELERCLGSYIAS